MASISLAIFYYKGRMFMIDLRNQRGSITLFVLISCMFFVASVACVQVFTQSKKTAVDREYRQIKSNYEGNSLDENTLKENYDKLAKIENVGITIVKAVQQDNNLSVQFRLNDASTSVSSIKYGWGTSASQETVKNWTFIENEGAKDVMFALNSEATEIGDYHLFVVVNGKVLYSKITV